MVAHMAQKICTLRTPGYAVCRWATLPSRSSAHVPELQQGNSAMHAAADLTVLQCSTPRTCPPPLDAQATTVGFLC